MAASEDATSSGKIQPEGSCRCFLLDEVLAATNNFDDALVIGQGGFGKVYKGFIGGSKIVAVKRLDAGSEEGATEFWAEVKMLSKLRHTHLVSLIGYCNDCLEMILVYEYMARGDFAHHLHKRSTTGSGDNVFPLTWAQRLNICVGAARALNYLHDSTNRCFIHGDVKTSNILLDDNSVAKICDFGLSKATITRSITHVSGTSVMSSTSGYLDPDYFLTGRLTTKSDVYSFGLVLLEVLSGRPAVDARLVEEQISLVQWAQHCVKKGKLDGLIDPSLSGQITPHCLKSFLELANNCLHIRQTSRPMMAEVLGSLELALVAQRKGRTEGIITKAFQIMSRCWSRHRKESMVPQGGNSEDVTQDSDEDSDYSLSEQ